jgi:hypothetical protein
MAKTGLYQGKPKAGSVKGSGLHAGTGKVAKVGGIQTAYTRRVGSKKMGRSR